MFSFFKRTKSRTPPSTGEKLVNPKIFEQDVTTSSSCKTRNDQLPNFNVSGKKVNFHENSNQLQNDRIRDRTLSTNFNEKQNIERGATGPSVGVEVPAAAVKKPSIFTEIMAKGRNRNRNKNKNNYKNNNISNNKKNDQQLNNSVIINNNSNSGNSNNNISLNNETIQITRLNDHSVHCHTQENYDHRHHHHNSDDVVTTDDEKQDENFSSSNLFLNAKNDENENKFVQIEINNISNNINFAKTTCSLPSSPATTTPTTIITSTIANSGETSAFEQSSVAAPPILIDHHSNDADFVKNLIIDKFKMGQPSSKVATAQNIDTNPINNNNISNINIDNNNISGNSNNNNINSDNNNSDDILDDQSDKEIFYEATDENIVLNLNEKPVLPDLNQLIEIQINECENIPNFDLISNNNSDNLFVNHNNNNNSSESDDISSDNSDNGGNNTIVESRILFDLRNELNEIKKQKVNNNNINSVNNVNNSINNIDHTDIDDNAFNNDSGNFSEKPKSIIKNKYDHCEKSKKRVTFLPDLVESTSIPPPNDDHSDQEDDDVDDGNNDNDHDEDSNDNSFELSDNEEDDYVDHKNTVELDDHVDKDKCIIDFHVEFETSSSEEDLEKDLNELDDQNSLVIVEEISSSEDDNSIIEDDGKRRDLVNQESHFNEKLEKVENEKVAAQLKIDDLQVKIESLEKEHSIKTWNVERLQAELISAYKEGDCVRKRLKQHEEELQSSRTRCTELEEEWTAKYEELQTKYEETQERLDEIKKFCHILQNQLAEAKSDLEKSQKEISELTEQHENEQKCLAQAIDAALHDKSECEIKWKKEFEHLRNVNSEREEHLMEDCEWQLRNMQKMCKEKVELAEKEKLESLNWAKKCELEANDKYHEVEHLKSYEAEVSQLRGLTNEQRESIQSMTNQIDELKTELDAATERAENEIENMKKIKWRCEMAIYDNQRHTAQKIEVETMAIACQWEQKLHEEMSRLTNELNQIHGEERQQAVEEVREECLKQLDEMRTKFDEMDTHRKNEIAELTKAMQNKHTEFENLQTQADNKLVEARMFLERAEHDHQTAIDREMEKREELLDELRQEHETEKQNLEEEFHEKLQTIKDEFAVELTNQTTELTEKHKRNMQNQRQQLQREKDEALQSLEMKYKHKLEDLENKSKEQEYAQQRLVEELKSAHKMERTILEQRDHQNNKEIETLHRKCRCLTNLFEEMRMRYERRDSRQEDLREISELKNRCEQQENDLRNLTESLREYQLANEQPAAARKTNKNQQRKNSQPNIKSQSRNSIDVIYEEVEPENSMAATAVTAVTGGDSSSKMIAVEAVESNVLNE